jgi:glycine hydroxymethyltransferase
VSRVRVNGKDFFSGDPKAATQQLSADMIDKVLMNADNEQIIASVREEVKTFMQQFPLYPELG